MGGVKVSIIIPAYNVAGYIEACLNSILAQTFPDFEVIVINDGSTDETGDIANRYACLYRRISVIHKQYAGVSAARNTGIEAAEGEYFLFFDGDDFAELYACEEIVGAACEKDADVLIYGYHRYRDGDVTQTCFPVFPEGLYKGAAIIPALLSRFTGISFEGINRWLRGEKDGLYVENPALWRCITKAALIRENDLRFDVSLKVGEDTVFISDVLSCAKRCFVLHKCYYYLVYRESSTIATYENDAAAKLEGKQRLFDSRCALTERVLKRSGVDIKPFWQGTVVMSVLELAFLFTRKSDGGASFVEKYRRYLSYAKRGEVEELVRAFKPRAKPSIKLIPFIMLRLGWHLPLYLCVAALNLMRYEFSRE